LPDGLRATTELAASQETFLLRSGRAIIGPAGENFSTFLFRILLPSKRPFIDLPLAPIAKNFYIVYF